MFSYRILKGVFEKPPALPKYAETWDVSVVLDYLTSLPGTGKAGLEAVDSAYCYVTSAVKTGRKGACAVSHSQHRFPAPSSKL